ncbi:MAG: protein-S-isoprenylcysteine O-methyltransferase [Pseudomonadota bacterium]
MLKKVGFALLYGVFIALVVAALWRWQANGWGTFVWIATMFAIMFIRAPHQKVYDRNETVEKQSAQTEKFLLVMVSLGMGNLPLIHLATGLLGFADYTLPHWATAIGAVLTVSGLYLFWRSHADLGRNWSPTTEIHSEQKLITEGIYRSIRHPMYTSLWLLTVAQPLVIHNWLMGFSGPLAFGILYFVRVPYEEGMMRKQFGTDYDDYCAATGRLIPRLG